MTAGSSSRTVYLLLSFIFLCFSSNAYSAVNYTVKKGDNLSQIARKYKVSAKELERVNHLEADNLKAGARISIPAHRAEKTGGENHNLRDAVAAKRNGAGKDAHVALAKELADTYHHVVKKGDTLSSVAEKYSISADELREMNNLKSARLKRGQRLLVKQTGPKTYVVKKGDTLYRIARNFDMEPDDLMELNELDSPDLKAGQKLYLEEKVDPEIARNYQEAVPAAVDEDSKKVSESEEFSDKSLGERLTIFAKKMLNIPYKFGGNTIMGIDCSAYVKKVYGMMGVNLPRTAREQFNVNESETLEIKDLSIGDLVFFRTYASFPSHVGIYLGNNLFIHASSRGKKVTIDSLDTPYYLKRFIGGKRFFSERVHESPAETSVGG